MQYIALLRGVNVGGHRKVAMNDLLASFQQSGFKDVQTFLNSGNVLFRFPTESEGVLKSKIEGLIENEFGFHVFVHVRELSEILKIVESAKPLPDKPAVTYVTFPEHMPKKLPSIPGVVHKMIHDRTLLTTINTDALKTTDLMKLIDQAYGKNSTTRNISTLIRIAKTASASAR